MDKVRNKNILQKNVQKKYAHTKDVNSVCPFEVGVIAQAQRNKLWIHTLDLKRKVCNDDKYVRTMYDIHELILHNDKMYVPQPLHKRILNQYYRYLSRPDATRLAKKRTIIM